MAEENFKSISSDILLKICDKVDIELYITLNSGKNVRVSNKGEATSGPLKKYVEKGVTTVMLLEDDYRLVINYIKQMLALNKVIQNEASLPEKVKIVAEGHNIIKKLFRDLSINEISFEIATEVNQASLSLMTSIKDIKDFFDNFKKTCSGEFLTSMMTSYFMTTVINRFTWQSKMVKEKASLGSMLCDITLDKQDFDEMKVVEKDSQREYPHKILKHPEKIVNVLQQGNTNPSLETINVILQHHENQSGTGFPKKIGHTQITILSCIHIVCRNYVEEMIGQECLPDKSSKILDTINTKYTEGNFKKAFQALRDTLSQTKPLHA